MHRVTLVFILFLLIPDLYIYLVYVVRKTRKAVLHCLYWLPTLLLAAGYVYFMFLTGHNPMSHPTQAGNYHHAVCLSKNHIHALLAGGSTGALHHPSLSPQPVHRYRTGFGCRQLLQYPFLHPRNLNLGHSHFFATSVCVIS